MENTLPSVPLVPREVLFGNPTRVAPSISPDGTRLAWIAPHEEVLNVWVQTIGDDDAKVVTDDRDRGIRSFFWADDNRHLLYIQDQGGDENWRLYATDLIAGGTRDLTPFDNVQAQVVRGHHTQPDNLLIGLNRDNEQLHDVYRLTLSTGELEKIVTNPGFVGWIADDELEIRASVAPTPDGGMLVMVRNSDKIGTDQEWQPLLPVGQEDSLTTAPLGVHADGDRLLMISSVGANSGQLGWLDMASGEFDRIAGDDRYDVAAAWLHHETHEPQLVGVLGDRLRWEVIDESLADDLDILQQLDDGELAIIDRDQTDTTWLVSYNHDDGPVRYYSYERASKQATFLFVHRPELEQYQLAAMTPFAFDARDGLRLEGYVTFPPEVEPSGLPAVLLVHGGPWARDVWGFDPQAQWLANRGYACIQVNFRGSTGYGKAHISAGDKQWGAKMHDDLLDTIDYVVDQGWVDRERVAIFGGSYGGYAALVGAAFTPDVFACAVDIVGPSNLITLLESIPPYWAPMIAQFHTRMGDPEHDGDLLWERSPLSKVDNISIPIIIAQGANDPRVKQAESEQIVAAMTEKGIPHEYLLYEDEGHGFAKPQNRLHFFAAAEAFLAQHLGGRNEP